MKINTLRKIAFVSISAAFAVFGVFSLTGSDRFAAAQTTLPSPSPIVFDQPAALAKLRAEIKGREKEPAEKVFKNIQSLKGVPAGRLLAVMEFGYARSLGVSCTHCHTPEKWDAEDKNTKQITREMAALVKTLNGDLLKNIKNLKSEAPTVNCTTCHRGQLKPALELPK